MLKFVWLLDPHNNYSSWSLYTNKIHRVNNVLVLHTVIGTGTTLTLHPTSLHQNVHIQALKQLEQFISIYRWNEQQ